jgi:myo-inositol-1(or 4)-monophosphatase
VSTLDPGATLAVAADLAREAGRILLSHFGRPVAVEYKGAVDLVTTADRESEAFLTGELAARFPDHAVLAEEGGGGTRAAARRWLVDPLDGTTNFAHGYPFFAVSLALEEALPGREREPGQRGPIVLGVVYDPTRDELWSAARGRGAALGGRPIRVSTVEPLARALVATGFPYDVHERPAESLSLFAAFLPVTQALRRDGSAALNLAYLACGRFDGFWERKLHAWDTAAGSLLIQEAGGAVSDFRGRPFDPFGEECVASNGLLHRSLLDVLARAGAARTGA